MPVATTEHTFGCGETTRPDHQHDVVPETGPSPDGATNKIVGQRHVVNNMDKGDSLVERGSGEQGTSVMPLQASPQGELDLAWDLVEQTRSWLSIAELNGVFIKLACSEHVAAIEMTLAAVARANGTVPSNLTARLHLWADAYAGHEQQHRLRDLIGRCTQERLQHDDHPDV